MVSAVGPRPAWSPQPESAVSSRPNSTENGLLRVSLAIVDTGAVLGDRTGFSTVVAVTAASGERSAIMVGATAASGALAAASGSPAGSFAVFAAQAALGVRSGVSTVVTRWASGVVVGLHGGAQLAFRVTDFSPGALVWACT